MGYDTRGSTCYSMCCANSTGIAGVLVLIPTRDNPCKRFWACPLDFGGAPYHGRSVGHGAPPNRYLFRHVAIESSFESIATHNINMVIFVWCIFNSYQIQNGEYSAIAVERSPVKLIKIIFIYCVAHKITFLADSTAKTKQNHEISFHSNIPEAF